MRTITVSAEVARRFMRRAVLLDAPLPTVEAVIAHLGFIQIDPVNVCGRMHDLILRNRVSGYGEGDLMRFLHGSPDARLTPEQRVAFEHHLPQHDTLVAFPVDAWPYLQREMRERSRRPGAWSGRLTPRERGLAEQILAELASRGPISPEDIVDARKGRRVWGSSSLAKTTLQKLFFHGRVLIAARENNRRLYDLPERVLPSAVLQAPLPTAAECERWRVLAKLHQRRLVRLQRAELPFVADVVTHVEVPGCSPIYCLTADAPLLAAAASDATPTDVRLLAPLDPLIYDRRVTAELWGFDYTWEAYTPLHKRLRGHYALPVLAGIQLVGHVDPKADREAGRLRVVSKRVRRGHTVTAAVRDLAMFLGLRR